MASWLDKASDWLGLSSKAEQPIDMTQANELMAQANEAYGQQSSLAGQLGRGLSTWEDYAAGKGPSVAQEQLVMGLQQQQQAQNAAAASATGANRGMALRNASYNMGRAQSDVSGQTGMARAAETLGARSNLLQAQQQLGGLYGQMRGQSIQGVNYEAQRLQAEQDRFNAEQAAKGKAGFMGAIGSAIGGIVEAISDERAKTNIHPAGRGIEELLGALKAYGFEYKDPERHGEGKRYGVMAQDMEKSEVGKHIVSEDDEGTKQIDGQKLIQALTAAASNLHERVSSLEGKKKKKGGKK